MFDDKNKLYLIHQPDAENRKIIHQYLDNKIPKISISCHSLRSNEKKINAIKCWNCNKRNYFTEKDYRYGDMPNNIDERYVIWCTKCKEHLVYEPNYFDCRVEIRQNNCILIGKYLNGYNSPSHAKTEFIDENEYNDVISKSVIYAIDITEFPKIHSISKKELLKIANLKFFPNFCKTNGY